MFVSFLTNTTLFIYIINILSLGQDGTSVVQELKFDSYDLVCQIRNVENSCFKSRFFVNLF